MRLNKSSLRYSFETKNAPEQMTPAEPLPEELQEITNKINLVRQQYALDKIKAAQALIMAPFGKRYVEDAFTSLDNSKAIMKLGARGKIAIIIVTSQDARIPPCPSFFRIIRIAPIPEWPASERYQSRFIKWAAPFLFPNISESIYCDSNLLITNDAQRLMRLFMQIRRYHFVLTRHTARRSWKDELKAIIEKKRTMEIEKLKDQEQFFLKIGLPSKIPIGMTNFLARLHQSSFDILNLYVLSQLFRYSERDQLALPYAIFRTSKCPYLAPEGNFLFRYGLKINLQTVCFLTTESIDAYCKRVREPLMLLIYETLLLNPRNKFTHAGRIGALTARVAYSILRKQSFNVRW